MNCETCRGPVIGSGFFTRIVHEKDCSRMQTVQSVLDQLGFPQRLRRCEICKENAAPMNIMCEDCTQERSGAKG